MSLDTDTVRRIANLARIKIEDEKLAPLADELNQIIGWIEQLSEVDTDGVAPMTSVTKMYMPSREDVILDG
jgi:aspartyl-tRNA(Asn)/glutamyl-tRNA(Gln) amidotransferase subunit C